MGKTIANHNINIMRNLAHIITTALMLLTFSITSFAAIQTGNAGANVRYEFNDATGELHIYGTGDMYDRNGNWAYGFTGNSPINGFRGQVKSVVIDEGVTSIGAAFFYQCTNLTSVSIPQSVKKIGYEAFRGCSRLASINIPAGVTQVNDRSFTDCTRLAYISVDENSNSYVSIGGVIYTKDLKTIVRFPEALNVIDYVIPEGVTGAATDALYKLASVQSVTIPTSMTHIDYGSFDTSPKLETLVFKSMTPPSFGKKTGEAISALKYVYVPCGAQRAYKQSDWAGFTIGSVSEKVLVDFEVHTNDPELGDVSQDRTKSVCGAETAKIIITAVPTAVGVFDHWQDGVTTNPRTIEVPATSAGKIVYTAYFEPKEFSVKLEKDLKAVDGKKTRDINNDIFQLSIEHNGTTKTTPANGGSVTGKYHYGDVITLYCDVVTTGYKFNKWSDGNTDNPRTYVVTGDVTLKAQLKVGDVKIETAASGGATYGTTTPASTTVSFGTDVTIKATPTANYIFARWDDGDTNAERVVTATVDKKYIAYFNVKTFKVSVDINDETMGTVAGYGTFNAGTNVSLVATPNAGYEFVGWSGDKTGTATSLAINSLDKNYNLIATFKPKEYTITFKKADGTTLSSKKEKYNTMPTVPADPTKASTAEYSYDFAGWSPEVAIVTKDQTYTPTFTPKKRSYTIKFVDGDGNVKQESLWEYGTTPAYSGATPTKTSTAQYTYTFKGWDKTIAAVTGNATYTAQFDATVKKYDITFVDDDGTTILKATEKVAYGTVPSKPANPTKTTDAQYTYSFSGWTPAVVAVTGNQIYKATYSKTLRKYAITFKDGDGKTLQTVQVDYGKVPAYSGATPTKAMTAEYSYTFNNTWSPALSSVKGDATYTAQFNATKRKYTVTFYGHDGTTVLQSSDVEYGQTPKYTGATPTKPASASTTYKFNGWNPAIEAVKGNVSYIAQFIDGDAVLYTITFKNYDGTKLLEKQYKYNDVPSYSGTPTHAPTQDKVYDFSGWTPTIAKVTGDKTYTATYTSAPRPYTIKFVDEDGVTTLQESEFNYGVVPTYSGAKPTKAETAAYTYEFSNWTPALAAVTGAKTYKAVYTATKKKFTVTFVDYDNTVLKTQEVEYNANATAPANPSRTGYTFAGWQGTYTKVTKPVTIKATYDINKYKITFKNYDGTILDEQTLEYNTTPSYAGTPTRPKTAQYEYIFASWDKTIGPAVADAIYTATYESLLRDYTIEFCSEDGKTVLQTSKVAYGTKPEYTKAEPTKAATAEFTYKFSGWTPSVVTVTGDAKYIATFDNIKNEYEVSFVNWDGTLLNNGKKNWKYGDLPYYEELPLRPSTAQYDYNFIDWNPSRHPVDGPQVYTAQYGSVVRSYEVKFYDYDGTTLLYKDNFEYGTMPEYKGAEPTRTSNGLVNYTFTGWTPDLEPVQGEKSYNAVYSTADIIYTITFADYNGDVIATKKVAAGSVITYDTKPTRESTAQYSYEFKSWSPALTAGLKATSDVTFTAQYDEILREYDVRFENDDHTEIVTSKVKYGVVPAKPADPTKAQTAQYSYEFIGWDKPVEAVEGDITYTAVFKPVVRKYGITFVDYNGDVLQSGEYEYGVIPECAKPTREKDAQYTYIFDSWEPAVSEVVKNETYKATYTAVTNKYTVTFKNDDGTVIESAQYNYGDMPKCSKEPVKPATKEFTYIFAGWDKTVDKVVGDAEYKATYTSSKNSYTIIFADEDGTTIKSYTVEYGVVPEYDGETPVKASTRQYKYEFAAWSPAVAQVTDDATYKATYKSELRKYAVTFKNGDVVLQNSEVAYGTIPSYDGAKPTKESDTEFDYTFSGWSPSIKEVEGEATYVAQFAKSTRKYMITFVNYDGSVLQQTEYEYGVMPKYDGTPIKPSDGLNNYTFMFWSPELTYVTGDMTYNAMYSSAKVLYNVVFYDYDGTILNEKNFEPGQLLVAILNPQRSSDDKHSYEFAGWDPEITPGMTVNSNMSFTATYKESARKYTISFVLDDGTVISSSEVEYGKKPSAPKDVVKTPTEEFSYTFKSWDKKIVAVTEDATYTAQFDASKRKYLIRFLDYDGTELQLSEVEYGVKPTCDEPVRNADIQNSYVFSGWDKQIVAVVGEETYTAVYSSIENSYVITFKNDDGTVLDAREFKYGTMPSYDGTPFKNEDEQYVYTFSGWDKELAIVTGNATYTAQYSTATKSYTITFVNFDDAVLQQTEVEYGVLPAYTGETPERQSEGATNYIFKGWLPEIAYVNGDATYKAVYSTADVLYTVKFVDSDGTVLLTKKFEKGEHLTVDLVPQRDSDDRCSYKFIGWNPAVTADMVVTSDLTFTAVYEEIMNKYSVEVLCNNDLFGSVTGGGEYEYGQVVTLQAFANNGYEFVKWEDDAKAGAKREIKVTGNMSFTAVFDVVTTECYMYAPSVALYDWLLMVDKKKFSEMGFEVASDEVKWYRVVDEQDDDCDDSVEKNDVEVGIGFYYTMENNLIGTGDYYAIVNTNGILFRTQLFEYSGSNKVLLLPTKASRGQVLHITGLVDEAVISVYDINGRLVKTVNTDGSPAYDITAEGTSGVYVVRIFDGRETVVKYLVK